jgi:hypothetical protein
MACNNSRWKAANQSKDWRIIEIGGQSPVKINCFSICLLSVGMGLPWNWVCHTWRNGYQELRGYSLLLITYSLAVWYAGRLGLFKYRHPFFGILWWLHVLCNSKRLVLWYCSESAYPFGGWQGGLLLWGTGTNLQEYKNVFLRL